MATTQGLHHISRAELPRLENKMTFLSTLKKPMDKTVMGYVYFIWNILTKLKIFMINI